MSDPKEPLHKKLNGNIAKRMTSRGIDQKSVRNQFEEGYKLLHGSSNNGMREIAKFYDVDSEVERMVR